MFVGVFVGVNVGVKNDKKWAFPGFKVPEPIEGRRVGLYSLRSRSLTPMNRTTRLPRVSALTGYYP